MSTDLKQVNKSKKALQRNDNLSESKFVERLIKISRVSKVTKGGKKLSFRAIVVVGNENGQVGVGVGKADDVVNAFKKAKADGRKNLIKIPITKSLSIPHNVIGNFGACKIIMRPSIEGSGVIAGGSVRTVLEVAGIKNVIAKQLGSNNVLNNARAAVSGLNNLTTKSQVLKKRDLHSNSSEKINS
jgi:small subunit ribosomal protein S5|uniref:ribosomal protein S5 n=1 Tax=Trieres regia TaxID=1335017 RepID=UPI0022375B46|nr:ribosomal protein S5 [Odontella regia]UYC31167.1 ribosomal protein S5 [Odontella regia]